MCCDVCMRVRWRESRAAERMPSGRPLSPPNLVCVVTPVCACVDAWALSNKRGLIWSL
jgi:hypothetical protein